MRKELEKHIYVKEKWTRIWGKRKKMTRGNVGKDNKTELTVEVCERGTSNTPRSQQVIFFPHIFTKKGRNLLTVLSQKKKYKYLKNNKLSWIVW